MSAPIRLTTVTEDDQRTVRFLAAFPAPAADAGTDCRPAGLFTGDPKTGQERAKIAELTLCAPTAITWHADRAMELAAYTFAAPGRQTAHLRWGEAIAAAEIDLGSPIAAQEIALPTLALFVVRPAGEEQQEAAIRLEVLDLAPSQQVRVDAGAGQIFLLAGADGPDQQAEWLASYSKYGEYSVAVDLLDAEGYWLATLAQSTLELTAPAEPAKPEPAAPKTPWTPLLEVAAPAAANPPWQLWRYARPAWGGVKTYSAPGGGSVVRSLALGAYLAIQNEALVGGQVWQQSTRGDWVASSSVVQVTPTSLRGVELETTAPPPPPPPPGDVRYGVVTAALLNVRARPGVSANNPVIAQLPNGTQVTIYEEQAVDGALWYRIGDSRWVHSGWVRIVQEPPPPALRRGVVTADVLNVRSRPGVNNPIVDQLRQGAEVTIYEEQPAAGVPWYRIGVDRWVHSGWVRILAAELAEPSASLAAAGTALPLGWVVSASLNVRARPGVSPDNPPIDEVLHNQRLDILETRTVEGARWYRIGQERWVLGQWVAAALPKARPGSIGASQRWVGVNLAQQTAVAYEGDRPVYAAMAATGLPATPTVQGVFRTWQRLTSTTMSGGSGSGYYYLEGVTWTCYFYSGYALHTAYWHDAFGRPRSHGCVNLSPYDAWWLFQWSAPGGANSPAVVVYAG